jgi:hypothetical protein
MHDIDRHTCNIAHYTTHYRTYDRRFVLDQMRQSLCVHLEVVLQILEDVLIHLRQSVRSVVRKCVAERTRTPSRCAQTLMHAHTCTHTRSHSTHLYMIVERLLTNCSNAVRMYAI